MDGKRRKRKGGREEEGRKLGKEKRGVGGR